MTDAWRKDWGTWHEYCRKLKRYYDATDVAITERPELEPWGMNPPPCVIVDATLAHDAAFREMEAQLCRAREQLKLACEWLVGSNYSTVDLEKMMHDINAIPSSPCRHAAIVERVNDTEGMAKVLAGGDDVWEGMAAWTRDGYRHDAGNLKDHIIREG